MTRRRVFRRRSSRECPPAQEVKAIAAALRSPRKASRPGLRREAWRSGWHRCAIARRWQAAEPAYEFLRPGGEATARSLDRASLTHARWRSCMSAAQHLYLVPLTPLPPPPPHRRPEHAESRAEGRPGSLTRPSSAVRNACSNPSHSAISSLTFATTRSCSARGGRGMQSLRRSPR